MKAMLWIHENKCRVLIYSADGNVIDTSDDWNNRASAEMCVMTGYPEAQITFVRHTETDRIKQLNAEWNACVLGS